MFDEYICMGRTVIHVSTNLSTEIASFRFHWSTVGIKMGQILYDDSKQSRTESHNLGQGYDRFILAFSIPTQAYLSVNDILPTNNGLCKAITTMQYGIGSQPKC